MYASDEMADVRADYADVFLSDQTATILNKKSVPNGAGGFTVTYVPVPDQGPLPARLVTAQRERQKSEGEGLTTNIRFRVELPVGTAVLTTDQIQVGGLPYKVIGSDKGRPEALCLSVEVERVGT